RVMAADVPDRVVEDLDAVLARAVEVPKSDGGVFIVVAVVERGSAAAAGAGADLVDQIVLDGDSGHVVGDLYDKRDTAQGRIADVETVDCHIADAGIVGEETVIEHGAAVEETVEDGKGSRIGLVRKLAIAAIVS